MKPVDQTKFGEVEGNCLAACVASIFEIGIADVPDLSGDDWWSFLRAWCHRRGFYPVLIEAGATDRFLLGFAIKSGRSPRGKWDHAVVALKGEMVHDPHHDRTGILTTIDWIIFVPVDPAPTWREAGSA